MTLPTNTSPDVVVLRNGSLISMAFFQTIQDHVLQQLPTLIPGSDYTVKQMCREAFWLSLSDGERRSAGACVLNMVETGQLKLTCRGRNSGNAYRYRPF